MHCCSAKTSKSIYHIPPKRRDGISENVPLFSPLSVNALCLLPAFTDIRFCSVSALFLLKVTFFFVLWEEPAFCSSIPESAVYLGPSRNFKQQNQTVFPLTGHIRNTHLLLSPCTGHSFRNTYMAVSLAGYFIRNAHLGQLVSCPVQHLSVVEFCLQDCCWPDIICVVDQHLSIAVTLTCVCHWNECIRHSCAAETLNTPAQCKK